MFKEIEKTKEQNTNYTDYLAAHMRYFTDWNLDDTVVAGIPSYMPMLSHVTRIEVLNRGNAPKGFLDTRFVVMMHNHQPLECIGGCNTLHISTNLTQMNHYRLKHGKNFDDRTFEDTIIWKFKDELVLRTTKALEELGLISKKRSNLW